MAGGVRQRAVARPSLPAWVRDRGALAAARSEQPTRKRVPSVLHVHYVHYVLSGSRRSLCLCA